MSQEGPALLVDDNEDNRYTLTQRLKRHGYANVATAQDGREALDVLRTRPFDLVLLDIMMPEVNGDQVLEQLKADDQLRHIPVVSAVDDLTSCGFEQMLRAHRSEREVRRCPRMGESAACWPTLAPGSRRSRRR